MAISTQQKSSDTVNILGHRLDNSKLNRMCDTRIAPIKWFAILLFSFTIFFPTIFFDFLDYASGFNSSSYAGGRASGQNVKNGAGVAPLAEAQEKEDQEKKGKKITLADIWPDKDAKPADNAGATGTAAKIEIREVGLPNRLTIPSINVDANIQSLGVASNGEMETPTDTREAGWFRLGPRPGETGNAVLAGHLDTPYGRPAIFWHLHKLKAGDYIFITDENNAKRRFVVTSSRVYDTDNTPLGEIFGASDKARLNLITCNGIWDKKKQNYSERLVVSAEIAPE